MLITNLLLLCRPRVNYPTSSLPTVKDNQKSELRRCWDGKTLPDHCHIWIWCVWCVQTVWFDVFLCCHTGLSYPDPMVGASCPFLHRISELSSLEVETIRQKKRIKMKKTPKPPSWQSASSQSLSFTVQTGQSVPINGMQNKTLMANCSFQFLAVTACLSAIVFISCLTWLMYLL